MTEVQVAAPSAGVGPTETSLPALLLRQARDRSAAVALREKQLGRWREQTWAQYAERAARVGLGLRALGVQSGDRVAIQSENRAAWLLVDLGAQGIGAITVGVYPTSPEAELQYLLADSGATVLVAEDEEQLDKALAVRSQTPTLRTIVVVDTRGVRGLGDPMLKTLDQLEELGAQAPVDEWAASVSQLQPDETAAIVYTSGTTGPPKGAMLTHANLTAAAGIFADAFAVGPADEVLSYLPLSHVAERLTSEVNALRAGYVVNFGEGGDSFVADLREVQPTVFLGVPRVWEKMMAGVQLRMHDSTRFKRFVYRTFTHEGERLAPKRRRGQLGPAGRLRAAVGWVLLYRSLRDKLGLGRVRVAISGAAPVAPQVLDFFWALGVPIREGYGQTEGTAVATYTPRHDVRVGKVGTALPGVELRLADDGEILVRSPGVFQGYWNRPDATADVLDADGWLHSGDVGELDDDGFLTITDRKKDIIITSGGKNVAPTEIENRLKVSPYVREAIVVGDGRKHLVALIGIEADTVSDWATRRNIQHTTYADLSGKPEVRELIGAWVEEVNADLAQPETIKRFQLLPKELEHEQGELTPTQKVKRAAIASEFGELVEAMYR